MGGLRTSAPSGGGFYAIPFVGAKGEPDNCGIENIYICDNENADPDVSNWPDPDNAEHWDLNLGDLGGEDQVGSNTDPLMNGTYNNVEIDNSGAVIENENYSPGGGDLDDFATIPYERPFVIVVAVKVKANADWTATTKENARLVAYVNKDNMYVYVEWSPSMYGDDNENTEAESTEREWAFENNVPWTTNQAYDGTTTDAEARVNCVICNTDGTSNNIQGFRLNAGQTLNLDKVELWVWA
jgi:hypothetical protein